MTVGWPVGAAGGAVRILTARVLVTIIVIEKDDRKI